MRSQDIHPGDWYRILVGEVPAGFFVELLIRTLVVYLILMISMRSMGKRMSSKLSRNEMAALVSLAAAIGIPLLSPERGLLPAVIIAFVLISIERLIAKESYRSQKFESLAIGNITTLISDGIVDIKAMESVNMSHERIFAQLRSQGILQTGAISRFYMEANGNFTLVRNPHPVPGLCTLPPWDDGMRDTFREHPELQVCVQCSFLQQDENKPVCPNCGSKKWVAAVDEIVDKQ